jgi:hypothetical protein
MASGFTTTMSILQSYHKLRRANQQHFLEHKMSQGNKTRTHPSNFPVAAGPGPYLGKEKESKIIISVHPKLPYVTIKKTMRVLSSLPKPATLVVYYKQESAQSNSNHTNTGQFMILVGKNKNLRTVACTC